VKRDIKFLQTFSINGPFVGTTAAAASADINGNVLTSSQIYNLLAFIK
jgi:hypothetical protein